MDKCFKKFAKVSKIFEKFTQPKNRQLLFKEVKMALMPKHKVPSFLIFRQVKLQSKYFQEGSVIDFLVIRTDSYRNGNALRLNHLEADEDVAEKDLADLKGENS